MTNEAQKHLDKAVKLIAKGDGFYSQAADEIIAAQKADPTLSNREIGEKFSRSKEWVRALVTWRTTGEPDGPMNWRRGSHATKKEIDKGVEKFLADAPMELVERLIDDLPEDRKLIVAAAAGSGYHKERLKENERVKNLTPAQRKEIEAAKAAITAPMDKALGEITLLRVVNHIEQATDGIVELIEARALNPAAVDAIRTALIRLNTELDVAFAMAGLEGEEIT